MFHPVDNPVRASGGDLERQIELIVRYVELCGGAMRQRRRSRRCQDCSTHKKRTNGGDEGEDTYP